MKLKYSFFLSFVFLILVLFPFFKVEALDTNNIYFTRNEYEFVIDNANILSDKLKDKINKNSKLISEELNLNIIFISTNSEIPINKNDYSKNLVNYWGLCNKSVILIGFYPYSFKEPVVVYNSNSIKISDNEKRILEENLSIYMNENTLDTFITDIYKGLLSEDCKKENKLETILKGIKIKSDSVFYDFKLGLSRIFLPDSNIFFNRIKYKLSI